MFLKKLFNSGKDYSHYLEKGDRCLADERFSDARNAYEQALEKIEAGGGADQSLIEGVRLKIALTGDMLGRMNLVEAEQALSGGDRGKAAEHLRIIMELADDPTLRETSQKLLDSLVNDVPGAAQVETFRNCAGCGGLLTEEADEERHLEDDNISAEDRLALYFHTLPGDLPERYAGMGDEFGRGCLLKLDGDGEGALGVFERLSAGKENDILDYEMATIFFKNGDPVKCEQLLTRSVEMNPANPLCSIGLVHFYTDTERIPEALQVLERMISGDVIPEQALLMQGDLFAHIGDESNALESYSKLLASTEFAREAAERIVPILASQGRTEEAEFLVKKFSRGCC